MFPVRCLGKQGYLWIFRPLYDIMSILSFLFFFRDSHLSCSGMPVILIGVIASYEFSCLFVHLLQIILKKYAFGVPD